MTAKLYEFKPRPKSPDGGNAECPPPPEPTEAGAVVRRPEWPHVWTSTLRRIVRYVAGVHGMLVGPAPDGAKWPKQCADCDVIVCNPAELAAEDRLGCSVAPTAEPNGPRRNA
ncbi:MAG: hypothetical protein WC700_18565 [Gemmatimonadaceae bacterium]